jgi:hypothetical protein
VTPGQRASNLSRSLGPLKVNQDVAKLELARPPAPPAFPSFFLHVGVAGPDTDLGLRQVPGPRSPVPADLDRTVPQSRRRPHPVFQTEYALPAFRFCAQARDYGFSSIKKTDALNEIREVCSP